MATSPTAEHWQAGAMLGYGFKDVVGVGLGVRGGYTLPMNVYVGGTFVYHFGADHVSSFVLGVEGGYDFYLDPVIVRPYLGLGPDFFSVSSVCFQGICGGSGSDTKFAAWPGVAVFYPITENWLVGGDARVQIVSDVTNFQLFVNGGYKF
ncbi:MAG TPA: hypothetical protein VH062_01705 [Polyangiaceae bacterium]|nr:hypothetical protein [Polyangiaceae bacterium]